MVDITDIVDIDKIAEGLKSKLTPAIEAATKAWENFKNAKEKGVSGEELSLFEETAKKASEGVDRLKASIGALGTSFVNNVAAVKHLKDVIGIDFSEAAQKASSIGNTLKTAIANIGGVAVAMSPKFRDLVSPLNETNLATQALTATMGENLTAGLKDLLEVQSVARTAFVVFGQSVEKAEDNIIGYAQSLREMSAFTNLSKKDLNDFNNVVGRYTPEALVTAGVEAKKAADLVGETVTPAALAATSFKAFGLSAQEAGSQTTKAWTDFGQKTVSVVESLGTMRRAAAETDVDTRTAYEQISQASSSLSIFGQKIDSTANVWKTFTEALRSGGVPIKEIGNLVADVTSAMANMSVQNKAFIGMMSGVSRGGSAIGGALQMEVNMRTEGGMQKNLESLTKTLSQFAGGKVITLEEAAKNPQLENIFMVQRSMLAQMGLGKSDEQRNRILETLEKVNTTGLSQINIDKAGKEVFDTGKTLAEKQLDTLTQMNRAIQAMAGRSLRADENLLEINKNLAGGFEGANLGLNELKTELTKGEGGDITSPFTGMLANAFKGITMIGQKTQSADQITSATEQMKRIVTQIQLGVKGGNIDQLTKIVVAGQPEELEATRKKTNEVEPPLEVTRKKTNEAGESLRTEKREDMDTNISNVVNRGNETIHRDLVELISATRDGLSSLKGNAGAGINNAPTLGAGATEHNFTVRIVGDNSAVKDAITDLFTEFEERMQRNLLGQP